MRSSSLPLLTKCVGSLVLPRKTEPDSEENLKAKLWGSMVHYWKETGEISGPDKRTENALRKAIELSKVDRMELWPEGGQHEGAVAIRVDGKREVSRDDEPREGWITGHYDYTYWMVGGELMVDDLKTGKFYPNPEWGQRGHNPEMVDGENRFPQDPASPQILSYALGLCVLLKHKGIVETTVTHWPRLPLSYRHSAPDRDWHRTNRGELEVFWGELEAMYAKHKHNERVMAGGDGGLMLSPGDQCKFCPVIDCFVRKDFNV